MSKLTYLTAAVALWAAGSTSCKPWSACEDTSECSWHMLPNSGTISLSMNSTLRVAVSGPLGVCPKTNLPTILTSPDGKSEVSVEFIPTSSEDETPCVYEGKVNFANLDTAFSGGNDAHLKLKYDSLKKFSILPVKVKKILNLAQIQIPFLDGTSTFDAPVGVNIFSDGQILSLQQANGLISGVQARKLKFLNYIQPANSLELAAVQPFQNNLYSHTQTMLPLVGLVPPMASIVADRIFVTPKWMGTTGYEIRDCIRSASDLDAPLVCYQRTNRTNASDPIPADAKASIAGTFGTKAILAYVDSTGTLFTTVTDPGKNEKIAVPGWQPSKPSGTVPLDKVLLAIGDDPLTAGQATILVIYQDPIAQIKQKIFAVAVSDNGLVTVLSGLANQLESLLGSMPIDAIAVGKIDSDTLPDIAISQKNFISFLINTGNSAFALDPFTINVGKEIASLAIGQVDGLGDNDLVVALPKDKQVTAFLSNP